MGSGVAQLVVSDTSRIKVAQESPAADREDSDRGSAAPATLQTAGDGMAVCAIAVWTDPARSPIAEISLARSLVTIVADTFEREIPT